MTRGRKSKIWKYGLASQIRKLRSQGLSLQETADTINRENPTFDITKDNISKWEHGHTKKAIETRPDKHLQNIDSVFQDLIYKFSLLQGISSNDRTAFKQVIRNKSSYIKKLFEINFKGLPEEGNLEFVKVRNLLIDFSNCLCVKCRDKVVETLKEK